MSINNPIKSVLVIGDASEFIIKHSSKIINLIFFETNKFYLLNSIINDFDLIVFYDSEDNLKKFENTFKLTKSYKFNIPIILITNNPVKDMGLFKDINVFSIVNNNSDELLLSNIELCLNFINTNKRIQLEEGFFFDISRELLFMGKEIIKLTRTEKKLVKLFCENANNLVSYEEISNEVWKGKNFSIYSLRNIILNIREKTSENFIKNHSNKGYILSTIY